MFTIPEGQSFWQSFSDQVVHFKELTKDMSDEKMFSLMSDPACPGNNYFGIELLGSYCFTIMNTKRFDLLFLIRQLFNAVKIYVIISNIY